MDSAQAHYLCHPRLQSPEHLRADNQPSETDPNTTVNTSHPNMILPTNKTLTQITVCELPDELDDVQIRAGLFLFDRIRLHHVSIHRLGVNCHEVILWSKSYRIMKLIVDSSSIIVIP